MVRKKKSKKHKKSFIIKRSYLIFVGIVALLFLFINPQPAQITPSIIYQKVMHTLVRQPSEYISDAYVADILLQDGEYNAEKIASIFENNPINAIAEPPVSSSLATVLPAQTELAQAEDKKWIEVDLSDQKLYAWENGNKVFDFTISSGKPWTPTVTGEYRIWIKMRYATMKGGSKQLGDYYNLPNVPYVMYFYKGYGLHGTYWHNNFGHTMSHGCVNLSTEDAGQLFNWAGPNLYGKSSTKSTPENPGTRVVVHQ